MDFEDVIRRWPYFANVSKFHSSEDIHHKRIAKPLIDWKRFSQGQMVVIGTKRMVWDEYRRHMRVVSNQLAKLVFTLAIVLVSLYAWFLTKQVFFLFVTAGSGFVAGFMYRHAIGKYGNIKDFEDVPVLMPSLSLLQDARASGEDIEARPAQLQKSLLKSLQ
jgi:hypothetical protein